MSIEQRTGAYSSVIAMIQEQMHSRPEVTAIATVGRQLTYGELQNLAGSLAVHLQRAGLARGDIAAICLPPSPEFVASAMAIMTAGAAYLPIDQNCPPERLSFMVEDSGASFLVTNSQLRAERQVPSSIPVVEIDRVPTHGEAAVRLAESVDSAPDELAYLIYTSGSTGQPKGVEVVQRGLSNLIAWHNRAFEINPTDRASQVASLSFDAAAWEIWPYLAAGSTLCIPDDDVRLEPVRLQRWLLEEKITVAFAPTMMAELLSQMPWPRNSRLRFLLTGGEALRIYPRKGLPFTLVNNYGPTECTVVTTSGAAPVEGNSFSAPPIGKPIDNVDVYILGENLELVPDGQTGELCVGGANLARGYRNRPELTAQKFIPNPFDSTPGARLYRTGDLARVGSDGQIQFVGRLDDQIKIRGYRIEPNEVALAISRHPTVRQCVVSAPVDQRGEKQLVAYVVSAGGPRFNQNEIRAFLRNSLPDYMIPIAFVCMDRLPLTASGKVDPAALPAPAHAYENAAGTPVLPRTELERQISEMVLDVLNLDEIGVEENFFLLGGHSLLGAELIQRLRGRFHVDVSLRTLFESPTIAGLAEEVKNLVESKTTA